MENLPNRIKALRQSHNLTEKQVAAHLGITQQTYSNYECAKRDLPTRHLYALAKFYNTSADYLLDTEPAPSGSFDLQVDYINNLPLKNVVLSSLKLNHSKRLTFVRFLDYLLTSKF